MTQPSTPTTRESRYELIVDDPRFSMQRGDVLIVERSFGASRTGTSRTAPCTATWCGTYLARILATIKEPVRPVRYPREHPDNEGE